MKLPLNLTLTLALSLLMAACAEQGGGNTANKPANTAANTTASAPNNAAAEAEIKKLMDTTQAALSKNDADAMEKVYADNYMTVNHDGSVQNRAERLSFLRSGDVKYNAFAFSDSNIRVNPEGNGAITITKLTVKGTFKGKPMDGTYRVTGIYSKTKDGWKLAGSQSTRIEGAEPAKTDADKADETKTAPAAPANK
jgi:ketosteroid isomerase-like protein